MANLLQQHVVQVSRAPQPSMRAAEAHPGPDKAPAESQKHGRSDLSTTGPRVLAYSHDGYGLGHLRRNLRILSGLKKRRPDVDAAVVTGAMGAAAIAAGFDVRCFVLPAVTKVANGCYVAEEGFQGTDVFAARTGLIEEAFRSHRPDLVLVDRYPLGMKNELLPALEWLRSKGGNAAVVLGLRDIIDERATVQEEWERAGHNEAIRRYYDSVLVYGDQAVFDPISEYSIDSDVAELTHFTGYLSDELGCRQASEIRGQLLPAGDRLALCTLGGGRDAFPIAAAFLGAMARLQADGWAALLITGPYMHAEDVARLRAVSAASHTTVVEMVADLPSHLAAADAVVCMGGYNTMCEVLAMGTPAVVVPRVQPRQEQLIRASLFAGRGLVRMIDPVVLSAESLAAEMRIASEEGTRGCDSLKTLRHDGVFESAASLDSLLPVRAGNP